MSSLVARPQRLCRRPSSGGGPGCRRQGTTGQAGGARTVRLKALRVGTSYTGMLDRNADYFSVSAAPSASVCMPICNQYEWISSLQRRNRTAPQAGPYDTF